MPTYEYRCESCGHEFEEFQSITAKPIKICPKCGKSAVKRLISAGAGVIFRGSGFYQTDYRSEKYQAAAKKDSEAGQKVAAAPATAGESQVAGGNGAAHAAEKTKAQAATPMAKTGADGVEAKEAVKPTTVKSAARKSRT